MFPMCVGENSEINQFTPANMLTRQITNFRVISGGKGVSLPP